MRLKLESSWCKMRFFDTGLPILFILKFRLFRRRLTISSPRMAVRSALPWPLRWLAVSSSE